MHDKTMLLVVAIIAVLIIEVCLIVIHHVDGALATAMVGAIIFLVTNQYYNPKSFLNSGKKA